MMSNLEELMTDFYNTLVQIKYPKITTTAAKNLEITILNGENRLSLLSWLLCEKSPVIAQKLQKLEGAALEVELSKCYSEIGICTDKKILLGNCPLMEQLPTLRLLLDFMKCVFIETSYIEQGEKETIDDMLNIYINEEPSTVISNIQPVLSYSESVEYFDGLKKYLAEHWKSLSNCNSEKKEYVELDSLEDDKKEEEDEADKRIDLLFNTEKKSFIEAFSSIGSWPMVNVNNVKSNLYSMDDDINDIHTNFSALTKFLQAKEEISNYNVLREINKLNTLLNDVIEEAVTHTEEARNICVDNY